MLLAVFGALLRFATGKRLILLKAYIQNVVAISKYDNVAGLM